MGSRERRRRRREAGVGGEGGGGEIEPYPCRVFATTHLLVVIEPVLLALEPGPEWVLGQALKEGAGKAAAAVVRLPAAAAGH